MENSLSIQDVLNQKNKYNLAIPFIESRQINPFLTVSVAQLWVDTDPNASQIFKVGTRITGNNKWEDLYSLTKPFLQRLATEAGIQFAPGSGEVTRIDNNTWKASAYAALRLPDGGLRTSNNYKVVDLVTEEKKYRTTYLEKAEHGITDKKAAIAASKKYGGKWNGDTYIISEEEKARYVESSLLDAMAQLESNAPQKASTGAILRVIRDLLGIKNTYTMEELKKPFVVARISFLPDFNDPFVKQIMIQQYMQSMGNLFGSSLMGQPISQPPYIAESGVNQDDQPVEPDEEYEKASNFASQESPNEPPQEPSEDRTQDFCCDKCGIVIPEKVWKYSYENFGRPLCYKCQKIVRKEMR